MVIAELNFNILLRFTKFQSTNSWRIVEKSFKIRSKKPYQAQVYFYTTDESISSIIFIWCTSPWQSNNFVEFFNSHRAQYNSILTCSNVVFSVFQKRTNLMNLLIPTKWNPLKMCSSLHFVWFTEKRIFAGVRIAVK